MLGSGHLHAPPTGTCCCCLLLHRIAATCSRGLWLIPAMAAPTSSLSLTVGCLLGGVGRVERGGSMKTMGKSGQWMDMLLTARVDNKAAALSCISSSCLTQFPIKAVPSQT